MATLLTLDPVQNALEVRPLPSTGITQLQRYYEPVRHPTRPGLSLAGVQLGERLPPLGFPVLRPISVYKHAVAITPVGSWVRVVRSPKAHDSGLPHPFAGSAPTLDVSRPARRSLRVTACLLAESRNGSFPSKASAVSLPLRPLRLLPAGARVAGEELHLLKIDVFPRRTKGTS
jgi:hypothetical protein